MRSRECYNSYIRKFGNEANESYDEYNEVVSETEKRLLNQLKTVVIRRKRVRVVPVMFSVDPKTILKNYGK